MNQLFDRIESSLRQVLRAAAEANKSASPTADAQVRATALVAFVLGSLQRFARSGFKRSPLDHLEASLALLI
jgi:TetR/AcrR family transcriptional regulator